MDAQPSFRKLILVTPMYGDSTLHLRLERIVEPDGRTSLERALHSLTSPTEEIRLPLRDSWRDSYADLLGHLSEGALTPAQQRDACDKLKYAYFLVKRGEKPWQATVSPSVASWARSFLYGRHPDATDLRVARVGISSQMRRYRRVQSRGCCGSFDTVATGPDGNRYHLGCHYGH